MFTIITFGKEHAARIKKLMPKTPVYLLISDVTDEEFNDSIRFCLRNRLDGMDMAAVWERKMVLRAQFAGLKTMVWTTDYVEIVEKYFRWGVRDFTTNALMPTAPEGDWTPKEFFMRKLRDCCYQVVAKLEYLFTCPTSDLCR